MILIPNKIEAFLRFDDVVSINDSIKEKTHEIIAQTTDETDQVKVLFEWVRDQIPHTKDIGVEDVLKRNPPTLHITEEQIDQYLDYLCLKGNWHEVYFLWRPFLKDPEDDMILELAVRANCQYIVTYNKKDFVGVEQFGIQVVTTQEFLKLIEELS